MTLYRAMDDVAQVDGVPDNAKRALLHLRTTLDGARDAMKHGQALSAVARGVIDAVDLRADLSSAAEGGRSGELRWANVDHFLGFLARYEREGQPNNRSLQGFLERVTLRGDDERDETGHKVVLSTLHAAKGLEFPYVFLIGCVEGQLPHSRTTDPKVSEAAPTDVDEERRLFYVGVTRAKERLYLSYAQRRMVRGRPEKVTRSRFLEGLPERHLEEYRRTDTKKMEFEEIAELGRGFLENLRQRNQARS